MIIYFFMGFGIALFLGLTLFSVYLLINNILIPYYRVIRHSKQIDEVVRIIEASNDMEERVNSYVKAGITEKKIISLGEKKHRMKTEKTGGKNNGFQRDRGENQGDYGKFKEGEAREGGQGAAGFQHRGSAADSGLERSGALPSYAPNNVSRKSKYFD